MLAAEPIAALRIELMRKATPSAKVSGVLSPQPRPSARGGAFLSGRGTKSRAPGLFRRRNVKKAMMDPQAPPTGERGFSFEGGGLAEAGIFLDDGA